MSPQVDLRKEHRSAVFISVAIMVSLLLYPAIVEIIRRQHDVFQGFDPQPVQKWRDVFVGAALIVLVLVRRIRGAILKGGAQRAELPELVKRLKIASVVTFVFCELPAIVGLVLFLLGGFHKEFYLLLACSLAAMFVYFPKYEHWESWLKRQSRFY